MTYGEAHRAELDSIELVNGVSVKTLFIEQKPKRMSREDALKYYGKKCDRNMQRYTSKTFKTAGEAINWASENFRGLEDAEH